jgi:hypothetical protein
MDGLLNSDTFWLIAANIVLGLVILICCVVIGWYVMRDIRHRAKQKKEESLVPKDHLAGLKDLGITLNDGGEKIDETKKE